ncbi:MAG: hypothetical protein K5871_10940 [Lachnospiraceae bacterium]|nr:hypothetical protein [Lachnospiraceae bacterium]
MEQNRHVWKLVCGILSGVLTLVSANVSFTFLILGAAFCANPAEVTMNVNGTVLQGEESAEAAFKLGSFFIKLGGGLFALASVLTLICVLLLVGYFRKEKKK